MKRVALAILGAAIAAVALLRRRVPTYPTWAEYEAADDEGEALEPDVYLLALLASQGKDE